MKVKRYEGHVIESVAAGSLAERAGIKPGDRLLKINGEPVCDHIDYVALAAERQLRVTWGTADGCSAAVIRNARGEPLGLSFGESMRLRPRRCANKCVFCFVDQLPGDMRGSLYVKDDDWRMSLMMGNYVTLTNLTDAEFSRLLRRRASPLYLSVHTLDPALRARMLGTERGADIRDKLDALRDGGIRFHAQIVMCPGWNDRDRLDETINGLISYIPNALSVAVVPVGLTRHRSNLPELLPVDRESARDTLERVRRWQEVCRGKAGSSFVYAADELFVKAGEAVPPDEDYEDYPQIENGVGLLRRFAVEYVDAVSQTRGFESNGVTPRRRVVIATGVDAAPFLREMVGSYPVPGTDVTVRAITNRFFGETVTVSGLITGRDFADQLQHVDADEILIPASTLNGDGLFLDGWTLDKLQGSLAVPVRAVMCTGDALMDALRQ